MLTLLALAPLALFLLVMYVLGWGCARSGFFSLIVTVLVGLIFWGMSITQIFASFLQGWFVMAEVLYLIFAAFVFLNTLNFGGVLSALYPWFSGGKGDPRVQIIVVGWLFGSMFEGLCGFATGGAAASYLLASLGFRPSCAAMAGVLAVGGSSIFSCMGAPVFQGLRQGLMDPVILDRLAQAGLSLDSYLHLLSAQAGIFHAILVALMPMIMVMMMTRLYGPEDSLSQVFNSIPFSLFAGLCFSVPFALAAIFLGPEWPSVVGGAVGLAIVAPAARYGFLVPRDEWKFEESQEWVSERKFEPMKPHESVTPVMAWVPLGLLLLLLTIPRIPFLPVGDSLRGFQIGMVEAFGTSATFFSFPLFLPATTLLFCSVVSMVILRIGIYEMRSAIMMCRMPVLFTFLFLLFTYPMAFIYINSSDNYLGIPGMPRLLADAVSFIFGPYWSFASPCLGILGTHLSGVNTISNTLFASFQHGVSESLGQPGTVGLILQCMGGSVGSVLALHTLINCCAPVGLIGREPSEMWKMFPPVLFFMIAIGVMGLMIPSAGLPDPLAGTSEVLARPPSPSQGNVPAGDPSSLPFNGMVEQAFEDFEMEATPASSPSPSGSTGNIPAPSKPIIGGGESPGLEDLHIPSPGEAPSVLSQPEPAAPASPSDEEESVPPSPSSPGVF